MPKYIRVAKKSRPLSHHALLQQKPFLVFIPYCRDFVPIKYFRMKKNRLKIIPTSLPQKVFEDENHHFVP